MPVHQILNSTNVWTGFNSFNVNLPTTTKTSFALNEFVTKSYVDSMPVHGILNSDNLFTGINTFNNTLISNNITAPTTTSTNNISTNLGLDGGIINIGAIASNINIKCSLNINESVYGTSQKL